MSEEAQPIVWLIDEDRDELRMYQRYLQKAFVAEGVEITVEPVVAREHMSDYNDILQDQRTVGIVVDHLLNQRQGIDHTGIALAVYLRNLVPRLPIYILTNFPDSDDFAGNEWSVEDILAKGNLRDADKRKAFASRLWRQVETLEIGTKTRIARFQELLMKSLEDKLTRSERKEFDALRAERTAVIAVSEADKLQQLEEALAKVKRLRGSHND